MKGEIMNKTVESKFQYTNPIIKEFKYSFTELPAGEWKIELTHEKKIEKISSDKAKVILSMLIKADVNPSIFEIYFECEANFKWDGYDNSTISSLLSQTAPALLVGYARPIVALFTNSSGIPSFNIPLIDFTRESIVDFSTL